MAVQRLGHGLAMWICSGLLLWCSSFPEAVRAQPASPAVGADSAAVAETVLRPTPDAVPGPARLDSSAARLTPRQVLIRSAIVPGWGQLAGGHPYKALLFAAAAGGFLGAASVEWRAIDDAADASEQEWRAARRNTRLLWFFTSVTAAALDAYVDAHLADFGGSADLALRPAAGSEPGLLLACTLHF